MHLGDYSTITCGELTGPFVELGHLLGDSSLVGVYSDRKALSATGLPRLVQAFNSSSPECFARLHSKLDDQIERLLKIFFSLRSSTVNSRYHDCFVMPCVNAKPQIWFTLPDI